MKKQLKTLFGQEDRILVPCHRSAVIFFNFQQYVWIRLVCILLFLMKGQATILCLDHSAMVGDLVGTWYFASYSNDI
jgi:hypothetical protein